MDRYKKKKPRGTSTGFKENESGAEVGCCHRTDSRLRPVNASISSCAGFSAAVFSVCV
jgi:hypothetical protein